jgi:uncharacterized protein (TIGR00255 family)
MTAFARREAKLPQGVLVWELRTLNHRYLEATLRLPEEFRVLESAARELIAKNVRRGKLEGALRFQGASGGLAEPRLDEELVRKVIELHQHVEAMMSNPARLSSADILKWPDVLQAVDVDYGPLHREALRLLGDTLTELIETRAREGATIQALILQRSADIRRQLESVRARMPAIIEGQRAKLLARLEELGTRFDAGRLEQEVLYTVQKADVEEELDRIGVHLDEVERVLGDQGAVGRRLDFLMQELNREANTLGSKSIDAATTLASVEIKVAIEQMREQIQNVE